MLKKNSYQCWKTFRYTTNIHLKEKEKEEIAKSVTRISFQESVPRGTKKRAFYIAIRLKKKKKTAKKDIYLNQYQIKYT